MLSCCSRGRGEPTVKAQQYCGATCVAGIDTDYLTYCPGVCTMPDQDLATATTISDPAYGPWSYNSTSVNCGSCPQNYPPGTCNVNTCGVQYHQTKYVDPCCCNGWGDGCANNSDCCSPLKCLSSGMCLYCLSSGTSCTVATDCCSGTCSCGLCQ